MAKAKKLPRVTEKDYINSLPYFGYVYRVSWVGLPYFYVGVNVDRTAAASRVRYMGSGSLQALDPVVRALQHKDEFVIKNQVLHRSVQVSTEAEWIDEAKRLEDYEDQFIVALRANDVNFGGCNLSPTLGGPAHERIVELLREGGDDVNEAARAAFLTWGEDETSTLRM